MQKPSQLHIVSGYQKYSNRPNVQRSEYNTHTHTYKVASSVTATSKS